MAQNNIAGDPTRKLSVNDISGDITTQAVRPETGLTEDSKPLRKLSIADIDGTGQDASSLVFQGSAAPAQKVLGENAYHPELDPTYNQQLLHERQTATSMIGNSIARFGIEAASSALQAVAYDSDLTLGADLAENTQQEFGNELSRFAESLSERGTERFPIYIDPYKAGNFDPGSLSWWAENATSVGSSLGMILPAMGLTALTGGLGAAAGLGSIVGTNAFKGITTALWSRYAENMMEASGVYKDNYSRSITQGMSETDAKNVASLAASNTYKKQWALLVQDIPQYILLNKLGGIMKDGKAAEKVALEEMSSPVAKYLGYGALETTAAKVGAVAMDMAGEGGEEIYQFLINEQSNLMAMDQANKDEKIGHSMLDSLKQNYDNGEMWTAGFFGAIGAGVMQAGMSGLNYKMQQAATKAQLDTVTSFGPALKQAGVEYSAALESGDPIKADQAVPGLIVSMAMKAKMTNTIPALKKMLNEMKNAPEGTSFDKWGVDPTTQGKLKQDPDFFNLVDSGIDRVSELYDRYLKENNNNKSIKDNQKDPSAQVMANTQFLLESTEKQIPKIEKRKNDAWAQIEKVEQLSQPAQQVAILEAQKRSTAQLLNHFETSIKERGDKMGEVEKKEVEGTIADLQLEAAQLDNSIKDAKKEVVKLHKSDPKVAESDKNIVLPEDQIDLFRKETTRLDVANKSLAQLTKRMQNLRSGTPVVDIQKEELKESIGATDINPDAIQLGDRVEFQSGVDGKDIVIGTIIGVEEGETPANSNFIIQPIDEATGKEIGEPISKPGVDLFLDEKRDDKYEDEIAPEGLSSAEERIIDGETEEEVQETIDVPFSTISKLSYSDREHGSRNSELSKVISNPKTSFAGSKAYYYVDNTNEANKKLVSEYVTKYATPEQAKVLNKYISGKKLSEAEIEVVLKVNDKSFNTIADLLPISVRVVIEGKVYESGLFLHSSAFKGINIPKSIKRGKKANIDAYRIKAYNQARSNRIELLKRVLAGQEVYSIGLNRSRGVPNVMDKKLKPNERNRKLSTVFGETANKLRLGITVSNDITPEKASLRDSKDNIISGTERAMNNAGNVYALLSGETIDGSTYPLKLNRPFISREHGEILFDAFVLVGRTKVTKRKDGRITHAHQVNFMSGEDRVTGLKAGEVIDLLVNHGRKVTEPFTGRFKKRNVKPNQSVIMANKRLYVTTAGPNAILVYGNDPKTNQPYTIDLSNNTEISLKRTHFLDWITTNKRYAIYLSSKALKQTLNGDFLNKKTFKIGKTHVISRKGEESYSEFVINNQLVETDAVRDESGNLFHDPVINLNITDKYGKVTDKTIKVKDVKDPFVRKEKPVVGSTTTVREVPAARVVEKEEVEDARAFSTTQTVAEKEEEKEVVAEKETKYKNRFATKKDKTIYHNGVEYAAPETRSVVEDFSERIESIIKDKKTVDETITIVKSFLFAEQLKIGSKGATANKGIFDYIKDRFDGKTNRTLLDEWNANNVSATKEVLEVNQTEEVPEIIPEIPVVSVEGLEEPSQIPTQAKSLNDIMGAFTKKSGNKMTKPVTSANYKKADIHKDIQWAYDVVGIAKEDWVVKDHLVDLIYGGRKNFALYSQAAILLYRAAEVGTVYHEAFHRVSLGYHTRKEREQMYRAARQIYKLDPEQYTDKQVEEFLATKFEGYVLSNGEKKTPGAIHKFFQPLLDFIKKVFFGNKQLSETEIDRLFRNINQGYYKNRMVLEENKDLLELGEYRKTMLAGNTFNTLNNREEIKNLIKGLTELLFEESGVNNINKVSQLSHAKLITRIEDLISTLTAFTDDTSNSDDERLNAQHTLNIYKEVLGVKDEASGLYDNYSLMMRPQIDSFLLSMGVKQMGIREDSDEHIFNSETDEGAQQTAILGESVGKIGGDYFKASYERNKKETALANIKFMIATLHEVSHIDPETGERVFARDPLSYMGKFVDFSSTWSKIFNAIYHLPNINDMVEELKVLAESENYSPFAELAERLDSSSEMTRNQFFRTLRSAKHNFINFSAYDTKTHGVKFTINKSAVNEAFFREVSVWNEMFFNDDKVTRSAQYKIEGQKGYIYRTYLRKEFFEAIGSDYSDLLDDVTSKLSQIDDQKPSKRGLFIERSVNESIEQILFLLGRFNINVDEATIRLLISQKKVDEVKNDLEALYAYAETSLSSIFAASLDDESSLSGSAANEIQLDRAKMSFFKKKDIIQIAKAYVLVHPELISDMQLGPDKNKYNTFSENNHITEVQNRINNEEGYIESKLGLIYNKHCRILNDMLPASQDQSEVARAEASRKQFDLRTFSYMQEKSAGDSGRGFLEITEREDYLIKYSAMFADIADPEQESLLPLPSLPRKTYFFMSGVRKFGRVMEDYKGGKIKFSKEVLDYFYGAYQDEVERIQEANRVRDEYNRASKEEKEKLKKTLIKNYHYSGEFIMSKGNAYDFIHFKGFDKELMNRTRFDLKMSSTLNKLVLDELEYANSIQVIGRLGDEYEPGMLDRTHTDEYATKYEDENIGTRGAIADFTLNYMLATIEAEKVFLADPAFFAKGGESAEVFDDIYKRWFGTGSSGENYTETTSTDPSTTYNVLLMNTQKFKAPFYDAMYDTHVGLWEEYLTTHNKEELTAQQITDKAKRLARERLSEYEGVNASDGQAWISPTMYKNMLERSGDWTPEVQKAFELLNSEEDLSAEDELTLLNVVLNPQKTLYFGNHAQNGLDVLIYDKMSMTVLFKRLVKDTHIEDLFDRMELIGKYKDRTDLNKIHVINFDSVVKVGGAQGYDLFENKETRGINGGKTNDFTNVTTRQQYWKHLRKQQVTDPHDHFTEQTVGSQVFKIASSNIQKTEKYGDYETGMDMLNALTASRVAISNLGKHKIEAALGIKNGRISNTSLIKMLRADAEKAKKPDDFVRALKVDQVTNRLYLELDAFPDRRWIYSRLMGLVTSNTIDLVTPGAQLIQSSDYGFSSRKYDNELKFNILEQGATTTYQMECKVSIRMFKHLIPNYSKLTHAQRVEAVKDLELPLLGYRIPTQGQNSVVSLKVAQFLQDEAGDVIHLPLEFTALTGSDFDIDKLYSMFHNFEKNDKGKWKKVEFISGTSDEAIQERYTKKVEELYEIYKNDDTVITTEVFDKLVSVGATKRGYMTDSEFAEVIQLLDEDGKARFANYKGQYEQLETWYNEKIDQTSKDQIYYEMSMLAELMDDIKKKNQIKDAIRKQAIPIKKAALLKAGKLPSLESFKSLSLEEQNVSAANQNRIIDIFHTIIRDRKHATSTQQPLGGVTKQLKARAARNERIENGGKVAPLGALGSTTPRFQSQTKFKFLTSAKGIGPFALSNAHHSFTQMAGLKMKTNVRYGIESGGTVPLDLIVGKDLVFITDWLSAMIDAHVDAVKDNYITKLNVNNATYGLVAMMLRLGFGIQTFDFVSQPILKEYAREYFNAGGRIKSEEDDFDDDSTAQEKAINKVWRRYLLKLGFTEEEDVNIIEDGLYIPFNELINNEKQLEKDMSPSLDNDFERNKRQLNILYHFRRILKDSDDLNKLVIESRVDTKKIGATPSEQKWALNKLSVLEETGKFPGLNRLINSKGEYVQNGTMLAPLLGNSLMYIRGLLENNTVFGTKGFDSLFRDISYSVPSSANMRLSGVTNVVEEMFSYLAGEFFGNPEHGMGVTKEYLEKLLLNGPGSVFDLLSKIRKKSNKLYDELSKNKMLSILHIDSKPGIPLETYLRIPFTSTADKWTNDDFIEDFYTLAIHPDLEVQKLARALYLYAYYSTGFRPRFRGYVKYIPTNLSKEFNMYNVSKKKYNPVSFNDYIYNLTNELNDGYSAGEKYLLPMKRDLFTNNWFNKWLVPKADNESVTPYEDKSGTTRAVEVEVGPNSKYVLGKNKDGDTIYASFITLKDKVAYNKVLSQDAAAMMNKEITADTELEEFISSDIGLFEFIGVNTETGFPIYKPINKKGFYEKGATLREYGIRSETSILAQNNLEKQFTNQQTLDFITTAKDEEGNLIVPYFKEIPFEKQQIDVRAVIQKEEYVTNMATDMMESDRQAREAIKQRILYDQISVDTVISGLQSGVDEIGLSVAKDLGYATSGRTTRDMKQEKGVNNEQSATTFGVLPMSVEEEEQWKEDIKDEPRYSEMIANTRLQSRTYWNVKNSDATVYFPEDLSRTRGLHATRKAASSKYYNKPFFLYISKEDLANGFEYDRRQHGIVFSTPEELKYLLKKYQVKTLNIAGSRYSIFAENNNLDKLEYFKNFIKETLTKESPKVVEKVVKDNVDIKSNPSSLSSFEKPITLYVDGSVKPSEGKYGYGVWGKIAGKEYALSGINEDVDRELFDRFPELREQKQFNPSVELLALINALKQFENTAEHLVIRQDAIGSVSYIGLESRAKDDPYKQLWGGKKSLKPHIKALVDDAIASIEKIEKNGGSVRIFYVPAHNDKSKIEEYVSKYSTKNVTITQEHIDEVVAGNDKADKYAGYPKKINTFTKLVNLIDTSKPVGLKSGFEKTTKEEELGKENKNNCKIG